MMSRKPFVVTIAAGGNCRLSSAFVATVVPCEKTTTFSRSTPASATPAITPSMGSPVVGTFARLTVPVPSSSTQTSVNVPPTSTATRVVANSLLPFSG
jgi:hypothetical protein